MATYSVGYRDAQAIVAEFGSHATRIGYAGDDHPRAIYRSTAAAVRTVRRGGGGATSCFVGPLRRGDLASRAIERDGTDAEYELVNPVDPATGWLFSPPSRCRSHRAPGSLSSNDEPAAAVGGADDGLGDEWESHELVSRHLRHALEHGLGLGGPHSLERSCDRPLLLLDRPHSPPALRQRLLEILFETHNLPATFLLRDAVAACYAVGRTTATVVDVGHSATTVTPVHEGFVESRGVLRNCGCGGSAADERALRTMDDVVKRQGGRRRKDRMRRVNARRADRGNREGGSGGGGKDAGPAKDPGSPPKRTSVKRDSTGHFVKESAAASAAPIPDYLMPIYQVKRAPHYRTRSAPFHDHARLALARELKESGMGAALGPLGYIPGGGEGVKARGESGAEGGAAVGSLNPAAAGMFFAASKLPYTLPDGTPVEISTSSRCDVAEVYFGNDEFNVDYRERKADDAAATLEGYEAEIEGLLAEREAGEEKGRGAAGEGNDDNDEAGDPYSATSYRGEKASRHPVGRVRRAGGAKSTYSPTTISAKLYAACLPHLRAAPLHGHKGPEGGAGDAADASAERGGHFHHLTSAPPAQMVCDAAFRCDRDQQASLLGNVVVCGGGACLTGAAGGPSGGSGPGGSGVATAAALAAAQASPLGDEHAFPDRLREEVEAIVHRHTPGWRVKVTSPNAAERAICSWLGGSILGSLGTFQDMWISREEYEEFGAAVVNRKCP
ncbi:hypothetical protein ACHAWF_013151 [Thalassiosira exigua]